MAVARFIAVTFNAFTSIISIPKHTIGTLSILASVLGSLDRDVNIGFAFIGICAYFKGTKQIKHLYRSKSISRKLRPKF
jgi:hypothetical protein